MLLETSREALLNSSQSAHRLVQAGPEPHGTKDLGITIATHWGKVSYFDLGLTKRKPRKPGLNIIVVIPNSLEDCACTGLHPLRSNLKAMGEKKHLGTKKVNLLSVTENSKYIIHPTVNAKS